MNTIGPIIAQAGALGLLYAERLLNGIQPKDFARLARPGGVVVQSNHPAFVFGHLSLYPNRVLTYLGQSPGRTAPPENYESLFKFGVECTDDPEGKRYPPMKALTDFFFESHRAALKAMGAANDEQLTAPNPTEGRMKELFPDLGGMLTFYLTGHVQQHLGQLSAWRRMMGLPPA